MTKLMSTAIIDFISSGFSFFSITIALITFYVTATAGNTTISGNFIFITFFIYFFTKSLNLFKTIINKENVRTHSQIIMNNINSIATFVLALLSLGVYFAKNDILTIIVIIISHVFITYFFVYDISIFAPKLSLYQKTK